MIPLLLVLWVQPKVVGNQTVESSRDAHALFYRAIYKDHRETFYCACPFSRRRNIDYARCDYQPLDKDYARAKRVEIEHVVPAYAFGQSFSAWRNGHPDCRKKGRPFFGRKCVRKVSERFRKMEADLYNLVPAIGELNELRENFSVADIPGEARRFGTCDVEIKGAEDRTEAPKYAGTSPVSTSIWTPPIQRRESSPHKSGRCFWLGTKNILQTAGNVSAPGAFSGFKKTKIRLSCVAATQKLRASRAQKVSSPAPIPGKSRRDIRGTFVGEESKKYDSFPARCERSAHASSVTPR